MDVLKLRARGDVDLAERIFEDSLVKRIIRRLEDQEENVSGVRRRLLSTALRVTPKMSAELDATTRQCREALGIDIPLETFIYPSSTFNAAAVKPEDGRLFILLSSSLLEAFKGPELKFVMGHELGHHLFGHHEIPIGHILRATKPPPQSLTLRLFAWSRYAEISADRAGAHCAQDVDGAARALFRLASGLKSDMLTIRIEDFAEQVEDIAAEAHIPGKGAPTSDWFSTHPFSPLRVRALKAFDDSPMSKTGAKDEGLEAAIQDLMALMEPSYLEERSEVAETMRRLLFAGAIAVADASGGISEQEIAAFEQFFGPDSFNDRLNLEAIKSDLDRRIKAAVEIVPHPRRIQVLRDLCVVANADGAIGGEERKVLVDIAEQLEVSRDLVDASCGCSLELD